MRFLALLAGLALGAVALPAWADPCEAVPEQGPAPEWLRPGAVFSGTVRYVGDGDMICVGRFGDRSTWVEVRLADFYAPELHEAGGQAARDALARLAMGQPVSCTAGRKSYDRIVARCTLRGRPIGDALRAAGVQEGGRAYRP